MNLKDRFNLRKGGILLMKEWSLEMSDGVVVYAYSRQPEGTTVGHIHILHGMEEHSGRYESSADFFVKQGYIVTGHDHRGHGRTAEMNGKRGHFADKNGFNRVVEDAYEVISFMKDEYPTRKFILLGHSMGSFIARRFIQLYGYLVDLVVLSATGDDGGVARYAGQAIGHIMGRKAGYAQQNKLLDALVFGSFNRGIKKPSTKFDWISKNNTLVFTYINDEFCGFIPTTQFFLDLFSGLGLIHNTKEIARTPKRLPILLFGGTEDPVGNNGKALWKVAKQYEKAKIEDVTVLLFEGGRHELLGDSTRKEVIQAVLEWIEKR